MSQNQPHQMESELKDTAGHCRDPSPGGNGSWWLQVLKWYHLGLGGYRRGFLIRLAVWHDGAYCLGYLNVFLWSFW